MKRWFSAALALVLCILPMLSDLEGVLAEVVDDVPEAVVEVPDGTPEIDGVEAAPEQPEEEKTLEEDSEAVSGQDSETEPQDVPADEASKESEPAAEEPAEAQNAETEAIPEAKEEASLYYMTRGETVVYRDESLSEAAYTIEKGGVLLLTDAERRGSGILPVSFDTGDGALAGYVRAEDVAEMTEAEIDAFKAGLIGAVRYSECESDYPLARLTGAKATIEEKTEEPEETEENNETETAAQESPAPEALRVERLESVNMNLAVYGAPAAEPTGIAINKALLWIGLDEHSSELAAILQPEGCSAEVTWSSSNPSVLRVDAATGELYGVRTGTAYVYARTANGLETSCAVAVRTAPTKVTLSAENAKLGAEGGTTQMIAAVSSGSASGTLYYFSSDEEIATVDGHGLVTGGKPGKVTITVWTYNGKGAAYELTVLPKAEKLELSAQHTAIATGRSKKVTAQAKSAEGEPTEADVTYYISGQSEDAGCVSIDEATGEVTGVRRGKALIGARTNNGVESNLVEIEVSVAPAGVTINRASVEIGVGETYRGLSAAVIAPAGETSCATEIAWTTSNEGIVKTDALTGAIYGVKAGTANIVVWTVNGKYAICRVTVKAAPTGIRLNASANMMEENGGTVQMSATLPSGSASAALSWFSSDPEVAGIDENGLVTGKKPGKVTITAWTYNGKGAAYELTVVARAASLSFGESEINLSVGQTLNLKATPLAEDGSATVANVSYYVIQTTRAAACLTLNADTGAITGTQRGTTLIGARTASGIEAEPIRVTVTVAPAGIRLNFTSGSIGLGETNTNLVATLIPPEGEDSCESTITWYTSDKSIVNVDAATGAVYGVKVGSAKIYAMTHNGKYAACTVNVKYAPTKITISPTTAVLTEGQTGKFQVTLPSGTASGSKYFYSSDPDVLSVDNNGNVKALTPGSATVTVWTYNGKGASAVVQVRSSATISADMPMPLASTTGSFNNNMSAAEKLEYVIYVAQSKLGKPYVWGAFGPDKFDCSGFTYYCFKQIGVELKQSAYTQGYDSSQPMISSIPDLRRGDLVFFNTVTDSDLSDHAGLYLGNGYFIHASSGGGKVMVSNLASGYYNRVFAWGRRVFY